MFQIIIFCITFVGKMQIVSIFRRVYRQSAYIRKEPIRFFKVSVISLPVFCCDIQLLRNSSLQKKQMDQSDGLNSLPATFLFTWYQPGAPMKVAREHICQTACLAERGLTSVRGAVCFGVTPDHSASLLHSSRVSPPAASLR